MCFFCRVATIDLKNEREERDISCVGRRHFKNLATEELAD